MRPVLDCKNVHDRKGNAEEHFPMKVLIADKFPESGQAALKQAGIDVVYDPDVKDTALPQAVQTTGAEVLVVRSKKVSAATLAAGHLSLVVRGGGV